MCGIVGYVGPKNPVEVLVEGLRRLEYRGYDSAGVAVVNDAGQLALRRAPGKLRDLEKVLYCAAYMVISVDDDARHADMPQLENELRLELKTLGDQRDSRIATRLQTLEGRIVTIPNSTFADSPVENVTLEPSRKVVTNLGLIYETSAAQMKKAMEVLKVIADETEGVAEDPVIAFNAFGDFAMNILFIYYIEPGNDIMGIQTHINLTILELFGEHKLDMAFPTQTVYHQAI